MKKLHKYEIILNDGNNVYQIYTVAENQKKAREFATGNGEIVRIREVSNILPSAKIVSDTLANNGFGEAECSIVYRLLHLYLEGTENA